MMIWWMGVKIQYSECLMGLPSNINPFQYFCGMTGVLKFFWIAICLSMFNTGHAQTDTVPKQGTASRVWPPQTIPKVITVKPKQLYKGLPKNAAAIQASDSVNDNQQVQDSVPLDSIPKTAVTAQLSGMPDTVTYQKYEVHPYLPMLAKPRFMVIRYHSSQSKDTLFFLVAGLVLLLALIRAAFSKYLRNLFLLFFQTSVRQKQTRDQLLQNNLASLITNFLFVISGGLYVGLLVQYKHLSELSFWWLCLGAALVLLLVYLAKYLFLVFTGWVFNSREAAGSYIFVVFMVNKIMAILLIPFVCILAFADTALIQIGITVSLGLIILLFAYRYWVSFLAVQSKLRVNALHFLLYLCAVELLPLVLIYKVLINYFSGSL
ncbi:MAG: DUF4271 domain-containing protein [Bacteroidota bacterium]|nr:DUF4271 domain-containing protein [Bacteroidota bacterium]